MKFLNTTILTLIAFTLHSQTIDIVPFSSGLDRPVNIQNAGDDRLFVLELDGYIRIIESDGNLVEDSFLDLDSKVVNIGGISERGLLGLAFHPNYASNGYFYVNYINNSNNTVISRFTRQSLNSADPDSELILLTINQPFGNHNGGNLAFGPDGYLYIASGDGGSGGDPQDNGQDLSNLLGKILRIDINNSSGSLNYAIPPDNPFVSNTSARDEIWAYGLRNPWKFSFDSATNELWIGDVGQNNIEEINLIGSSDAGINFGWRCYEGSNTFNTADCPNASELTFPIAEYTHSGTSRCSVTGGYRYRGDDYPNLQGLYFFADYCTGEIGTVAQNGNAYNLEFKRTFSGNNWSTFGLDSDGELYIASVVSGNIFRVVDSETLSDKEVNIFNAKIYPNPVEDILKIDIENNSEAIKFQFSDIFGRTILADYITGGNSTSLDLASFSSGIYFLHLKGNNKDKTIKIIKR